MSTIKVTNIEHGSTTDGGIQLDNSGHVTIDGQQLPTAGALSNRNLIINGAMNIAQRNTSSVTVSNGSNEGYSTVDRWFLNFNDGIGGAVSFTQSSDSPAGFANSAKITCSTIDNSFSSNQYVALNQRIEAQDLQMLNYGSSDAVSMTLSWYMKTTTYTGPISVVLFTNDGTAEYFAVSVTPTTSWARYSVTIPGSTTATINDDAGRGMYVQFVLAGNTSSSIAASSDSTAWSTTRADFRNDVGNLLSNTSNVFLLTGVQLEVGEKATEFSHEPYSVTLARCQRYFQTSFTDNPSTTNTVNVGIVFAGGGATGNTTSFIGGAYVQLAPTMRDGPTITVYDLANPRNTGKVHRHTYGSAGSNNSSATITDINPKSFVVRSDSGASANGIIFHYKAEAEL